LFAAVADCVEEAIYNALCCAESVVGFKGHKIDAIDLEWLKSTLKKHVVFDEKSL
jgi:D-aminopeptidase